MDLQRFKTLLLREWLQHRFGWLMVMVLPPLLVLVLIPFGHVSGQGEWHKMQDFPSHGADLIAFLSIAATAMTVFALSWVVNMFQLPGLARRDVQDRSEEFWLSMPSTHGESIGATTLMHLLLIPMLGLCVGGAIGLVMAGAMLCKVIGVGALVQVQWGTVLGMSLIALARVLAGIVLMSLWLAPISLALMAASAWLKRWGAPVLIAATLIGGKLLMYFYGTPIVFTLLKQQLDDAGFALLRLEHQSSLPGPENLMDLSVGDFGRMMLANFQEVLQQLLAPHFVGGLLVAALCFWLLMLRRSRAA